VGSAGIALLYVMIWQKLKAGAKLPSGLQYITPQRALLKVLSICDAAAPHISARKVGGAWLISLATARSVAQQLLQPRLSASRHVALPHTCMHACLPANRCPCH
jgi:hypothetical protein